MNWFENFFAPLFSTLFLLSIFFGLGFLIYKGLSKNFPFFVKYSLLRKKYPEEITQFFLDFKDQELSDIDIQKSLLLKGLFPEEVKEILYIYRKLLKKEKIKIVEKKIIELEGGIENGEFGKSYREDEIKQKNRRKTKKRKSA